MLRIQGIETSFIHCYNLNQLYVGKGDTIFANLHKNFLHFLNQLRSQWRKIYLFQCLKFIIIIFWLASLQRKQEKAGKRDYWICLQLNWSRNLKLGQKQETIKVAAFSLSGESTLSRWAARFQERWPRGCDCISPWRCNPPAQLALQLLGSLPSVSHLLHQARGRRYHWIQIDVPGIAKKLP